MFIYMCVLPSNVNKKSIMYYVLMKFDIEKRYSTRSSYI